MKKLLYRLFRKKQDIVFLLRMQSIDRHINLAVQLVSFNMLNEAMKRIEWECQYDHTFYELEQIKRLVAKVSDARQQMETI